MRSLYTLLFYSILPALFMRLWWKGRKIPGYRLRWNERLGFIPTLPATESSLWLHAVSLGEMVAAKPLIQALRTRYPDKTLVITTTTVTGSSLAQQYVGEKVCHYYLPYDIPDAIIRFLNRVRPQQVVIMETELWPNLLHYTAQRSIPVLCANARLSESSTHHYLRIISLTREMMSHIRWVAAQTQADADRFIQLGAQPSQTQVVGNIKFDMRVPTDLLTQGYTLRQSWSTHRPTVIAASTHTGEEEIVLSAFQHLLKQHPDALLILVPRHPERFDSVATSCEKQGYQVLRRTQQQPCSPTTQILLGDTMGELFLYYAMADIAFVGGSLAPIGGHNPLEPAAIGLPVIMGPHVFHCVEIVTLLQQAGAAIPVTDGATLGQAWINLLADEQRRNNMGKAGQQVVEQNRGAVNKHMALLG